VDDFGNVGGDLFASLAGGFKVGRCHGKFWHLKQRDREKVSVFIHARAT